MDVESPCPSTTYVEEIGLVIWTAPDLRLSPSGYDEAQVSARRTGVTSLNIQGTGANPSASLRAGSGAPGGEKIVG